MFFLGTFLLSAAKKLKDRFYGRKCLLQPMSTFEPQEESGIGDEEMWLEVREQCLNLFQASETSPRKQLKRIRRPFLDLFRAKSFDKSP